MSSNSHSVLVIGYGNSLRRDDGAGLILAERLVAKWQAQKLPVTLVTHHQLEPELADDIARSGADIALFVDAAVSDNNGLERVDMRPLQPEAEAVTLGHHLTPAVVMLYASSLYGYDGRAWLITVPGSDFGHGEGLSNRCQKHVDSATQRSSDFWNRMQDASGDSKPFC